MPGYAFANPHFVFPLDNRSLLMLETVEIPRWKSAPGARSGAFLFGAAGSLVPRMTVNRGTIGVAETEMGPQDPSGPLLIACRSLQSK